MVIIHCRVRRIVNHQPFKARKYTSDLFTAIRMTIYDCDASIIYQLGEANNLSNIMMRL